jgi:hypothetical protein
MCALKIRYGQPCVGSSPTSGTRGNARSDARLRCGPREHGPIYFGSNVIPDRSLIETTDDGGVVYIQLPPGQYVLTASKPGVEFAQVNVKCRPGVLVNASPP